MEVDIPFQEAPLSTQLSVAQVETLAVNGLSLPPENDLVPSTDNMLVDSSLQDAISPLRTPVASIAGSTSQRIVPTLSLSNLHSRLPDSMPSPESGSPLTPLSADESGSLESLGDTPLEDMVKPSSQPTYKPFRRGRFRQPLRGQPPRGTRDWGYVRFQNEMEVPIPWYIEYAQVCPFPDKNASAEWLSDDGRTLTRRWSDGSLMGMMQRHDRRARQRPRTFTTTTPWSRYWTLLLQSLGI